MFNWQEINLFLLFQIYNLLVCVLHSAHLERLSGCRMQVCRIFGCIAITWQNRCILNPLFYMAMSLEKIHLWFIISVYKIFRKFGCARSTIIILSYLMCNNSPAASV